MTWPYLLEMGLYFNLTRCQMFTVPHILILLSWGLSLCFASENHDKFFPRVDQDDAGESATDLWPQFISMVASVTAGVSSILAANLSSYYPLSFHATTPRWTTVMLAVIGYFTVYVGLLLYGLLRGRAVALLSTTLAFMSAPGVPLHGFLWAIIPQTRRPIQPPASEGYFVQCFARKPAPLLILTWGPLIAAACAAGVRRDWQGVALQLASAIAFIATARNPVPLVAARKSAFGRAGRYILLPRPGRRSDTVAYIVDLDRRVLLPPVRVSMAEVDEYQAVRTAYFGTTARDVDNEKAGEASIVVYLDTLATTIRPERVAFSTNSLWVSLEAWKSYVHEPAKELALMYGFVERLAYIAFRPNSCTQEERNIATSLNFINCRADAERGINEEALLSAQEKMRGWRRDGIDLVMSDRWTHAREAPPLGVDLAIPEAREVLPREGGEDENSGDIDTLETLGSVVSFLRLLWGHDETVLNAIMVHVVHYHNRIKLDLLEHGSIPIVMHGVLFSMKKHVLLSGNVYGHEWAAQNEALHWAGGEYALLDQSYARNSAIAFVAQLAVIVVKAVLEN